jgi:hypothetical protein
MSEGIYIAFWHRSESAQHWLAIATKIAYTVQHYIGLRAPGAARRTRNFESHTLSTFFPFFHSILVLLVLWLDQEETLFNKEVLIDRLEKPSDHELEQELKFERLDSRLKSLVEKLMSLGGELKGATKNGNPGNKRRSGPFSRECTLSKSRSHAL